MPLVSKLPHVGTTIFSVMSAEAQKHQAINLAQGFPDFPIDPILSELVTEAIKNGWNQYAPMPGLPALREQLSKLYELHYNIRYASESEITITSGATEGIYAALASVVRSGDEVIVLEPCYDCYVPAIELNGGKAISISLTFPEYNVPWEEVASKINEKTRAIILNTPHNPTGKILRKEDMQQLAELVRKYPDLYIISDEVYEFIIFDNEVHASVCWLEELRKRSFIIGSFGKTFHVTGWKVGYCLAPAELTVEFRKIHQFLTFATSTPFQFAISKYLEKFPNQPAQIGQMYEKKRNIFLKLLEKTGFKPIKSEGTYFQLCDYSAISTLPDTEFCLWLTRKHGVAAIPVSVFYHDKKDHKVARFCFAKQDDTLQKAAERLVKL